MKLPRSFWRRPDVATLRGKCSYWRNKMLLEPESLRVAERFLEYKGALEALCTAERELFEVVTVPDTNPRVFLDASRFSVTFE